MLPNHFLSFLIKCLIRFSYHLWVRTTYHCFFMTQNLAISMSSLSCLLQSIPWNFDSRKSKVSSYLLRSQLFYEGPPDREVKGISFPTSVTIELFFVSTTSIESSLFSTKSPPFVSYTFNVIHLYPPNLYFSFKPTLTSMSSESLSPIYYGKMSTPPFLTHLAKL
jgi:hypothetical protein